MAKEVKKSTTPEKRSQIAEVSEKHRYVAKGNRFFRTGVLAWDGLTAGKGLLVDGSVIQLYSETGLGKSTVLACMSEVLATKHKVKVFYCDPENGAKGLLEKMGLVDDQGISLNPNFFYSNPAYMEDIYEICDAWVADPDSMVLIMDSANAFIPKDHDVTTGQKGWQAQIQSAWIQFYRAAIRGKKKVIIVVSQSRVDMGAAMRPKFGAAKYLPPEQMASGSDALKFFADLRVEMKGRSAIKASMFEADGNDKTPIGYNSWFIAQKNREKNPFIKLPVTTIFGKGVMNTRFLEEYLKWANIILNRGARFYFKPSKDFDPGIPEEWAKSGMEFSDGKLGVLEIIRKNYVLYEKMLYDDFEAYFDHLLNNPE